MPECIKRSSVKDETVYCVHTKCTSRNTNRLSAVLAQDNGPWRHPNGSACMKYYACKCLNLDYNKRYLQIRENDRKVFRRVPMRSRTCVTNYYDNIANIHKPSMRWSSAHESFCDIVKCWNKIIPNS